MAICKVVATRSHDFETHVGCVIVSPKRRIVSTGYNGLPAGVDDGYWATRRQQTVRVPDMTSDEIFYDVDKYDTVTHAEANAIVSAGGDLHGCTLYSTLFPCNECAKLVITAGIKRICYRGMWKGKANAIACKFFEQAGIEMMQLADIVESQEN